jgi:hypothetical protein
VSSGAAAVSETNAAASAAAALVSQNDASNSATDAAASAVLASTFASVGLTTGGVYDFGQVSDTVIAFPTDFGSI